VAMAGEGVGDGCPVVVVAAAGCGGLRTPCAVDDAATSCADSKVAGWASAAVSPCLRAAQAHCGPDHTAAAAETAYEAGVEWDGSHRTGSGETAGAAAVVVDGGGCGGCGGGCGGCGAAGGDAAVVAENHSPHGAVCVVSGKPRGLPRA
jgi:hypothetical protein